MIRSLIILPDGSEIFSGDPRKTAVVKCDITRSVNSGADLTIGSTCSAMAEIQFYVKGNNVLINAGDEIQIFKVDEAGNRTKAGLFTCEKPTKHGQRTLRVTAYDRISWLDKDITKWFNSLKEWPYPLYRLAKMTCEQCGLNLITPNIPNGSFSVNKFSADGIKGRDLIQWAAQAAGRFCVADYDGNIMFDWYKETPVKINYTGKTTDTSTFYYSGSFSHEDYTISKIEKVQIQFSDNDVGTVYPDEPGEKNTYRVTGNYLLQATTPNVLVPVARNLYDQLSKVSYVPGKVSIITHPNIKAGDIVDVKDRDGNTYSLYIMGEKQRGTRDTLECFGSRNRDSTTATNNREFKALYGKVLNVKSDVDGLRVQNADTKGKLSEIELNIDKISSEVSANADGINGLSGQMTEVVQTANSAYIGVTDIQKNGVTKIKTTTGYTFGEDGLNITKSGDEMQTLITNRGLYVNRSKENVLTIDNRGVNAENETVRKYLVVGKNSRIEDYGPSGGGIFLLGGGSSAAN